MATLPIPARLQDASATTPAHLVCPEFVFEKTFLTDVFQKTVS